MKTYRELIVWQKSMSLVTEIYQILKVFPTSENFGLTSQIKRCSVSIPSNIAEGFGRRGTKEFIRFLRISMGSLFELQTQLEIAFNLKYLKKEIYEQNYKKSREIEIMLASLIRTLTQKI
jgi:four helix bundle protein